MPRNIFAEGCLRWLSVSLVVALAFNIALATAYLWSRGGQTTHVRLETRGSSFRVELDDRHQGQATFDAPRAGGIRLMIEDTNIVPSLPGPRGIDRVRVTSLDDGTVLLDEDFSSWLAESGGLLVTQGVAKVRDGVLGGEKGAIALQMEAPDWRDVRVDVTFRNITTGWVGVRVQGDGSRVEYSFRPFRHLDNNLLLFRGSQNTDGVPLPPVQSSRSQMIKSMVAMALAPYPWLLLFAPVLLAIAIAAQFATLPSAVRQINVPSRMTFVAPAALAIALFAVTLRIIYGYGSHMPHVPDEISYLFQAKVFAAGRLWAPAPGIADSFQLGSPPLIIEPGDKWASLYPFGHPLVLAIGARVGAVWLVPPLVGASCVLLVFAIGRRIYGTRVGLLAALLFAASPFVLMTASNFMSHNTAAFYLLCSIFFLTQRGENARRQLLLGALAGAFFGMIFNTRQLTGTALIPPFGLLLVSGLITRTDRAASARQVGGFLAGGALMLLLYLGYRWATTGDPFVIDPAQGGADTFGFSGGHSVAAGIANEQTQMAFLMLVLHNAPVPLGLILAALPFVLGTRLRWDWFFLVASVFMMGAYTLYYYSGLMHGPRFWYEATPLLMLLAARGVDRGATLLTELAARVHERYLGARRQRPWAAVTAAYSCVAVLALLGTHNWLIGDGRGWFSDAVPSQAKQLRGFNGIDDRLVKRVDDAKLDNALVLVEECPSWWCFGNVSWRNSPWLDGDVIYARNLPERSPALFARYPDRFVYVARYNGAFLGAYGSTQALDATRAASAPRATTIPAPTPEPTPTPAPTPTPDVAAVRHRDEQRMRDLDTIAGLLRRYREAHGSYPRTDNVQSLCSYPGDEGCKLTELADSLPRDPGPNGLYWYQSDGSRFTVFASLEEAATASGCPQPIPEHVANVPNLYCVTGANGAP